MRPVVLLSLATLAACAGAVSVPCGCLVPLQSNGELALRFDGRDLVFDEGARTLAIEGTVSNRSAPSVPPSDLRLDAAGFYMQVDFPGPDVAGVITELGIGPGLGDATTAVVQGWHTMPATGPRSFQLREILQSEEGYRLRGGFSAEVCLDIEERSGCRPVTGNFAFDAAEIPPGTESLVRPQDS